eukprot:1150589-Pelagomonas_calceolata.AAC.5
MEWSDTVVYEVPNLVLRRKNPAQDVPKMPIFPIFEMQDVSMVHGGYKNILFGLQIGSMVEL